jgi:NAD-dependent dihydropyrimidine dehydrogenase PreA subunit
MSGIAIITEACIDVKDRACVDVCPVQCIYEFDPENNALFSEVESGSGVTAGAEHDDLADTALESREGRTIEERGAARHPLPPLRAPSPERTPSQRLVEAKFRPCVAGRYLGTVEFRPC